MRRTRPLILLLAAALLVAAPACSRKSAAGANLPDGGTLLKESSAAMRQVQTVRFAIEADGTVSGLPLRKAGGQLKRDGDAKGTAQIDQGGVKLELEFVVLGETLHVKGLTGGWQKIPLSLASSVYDPSAILDPDRGIAKVLDTASEGRTEATEQVGGVDAYRVAARFDGNLAAVVPGAGAGVPGQVWIARDGKRLLKARFTLPGQGSAAGATVTVTFSEFDAPVTVSEP